MAAVSTPPPPQAPAVQTKAPRKLWMTVIIFSVGLHIAGGIVAAAYVVAKYFTPPTPTFVSKPPIKIPPKIVEQKMAAAEFEAMSSRPTFDDRMSSNRATDFALPDLPKMPIEDMMPLDPSSIISEQISSLTSGSGNGAGGGDGLGGGGDGMGTGFTFMGIPSQGKSVVIAFDVSKSVIGKAEKSGVPVEKLRDETRTLIESLSINTSFGIIQFSRSYKLFKPELTAPTDVNKKGAYDWLQNEFETSGSVTGRGAIRKTPNGIESVLNAIFDLNPDVAYLLSDASFQRGEGIGATYEEVPWDDLEKIIKTRNAARAEPLKIHFIGFQMKPGDKAEITKLIRRTGGRVREM